MHKDNEWFRGKPEVDGNYLWGGWGEQPDPQLARSHMIYRVTKVDTDNYTNGWWVRAGDLYEIPPVPVPRPEAVDTPVLVRDLDINKWTRAYLARWTDDGKIQTWWNGGTSWSRMDGVKATWNQWKLPEET